MTPFAVPDVVAHRGYALRYPENTLSAVRAAIDCGARYVEIDVQMTTDGTPVLFHDEDLDRLCDAPGRLQDLSLAEVRGLRAGYRARFGSRFEDERVPTLVEFASVVAAHPSVTAFVEIKPEAVARHGVDTTFAAVDAALTPIIGQCVLISFDVAFLAYVRQWRPDRPLAVVVDQWSQLEAPEVIDLQADYAFCDLQGLPATGALHAPVPSRIVIYEVGDASTARLLAQRGVGLVETFACGELLRELSGLTSVEGRAPAAP